MFCRCAVVTFVRRAHPAPAAWLALAAAVAVTDRDYAITASCLALIQPGSQATRHMWHETAKSEDRCD